MIKFSGSLFDLGKRAREAAARVSADVLKNVSEAVFEAGQAQWPVAADRPNRPGGTSKRLLSVTQGQTKGRRPLATIRGRAPYTRLIVSGGRSPWDALVVKPAFVALRSLPRAIGQAIIAEMGRSSAH